MDRSEDILNTGQQEAADGFFKFLLNDDKEMGITGPGGTGKTYLLGHLVDKVMPMYFDSCKMLGLEPQYDSVSMTSTTNKAAEVLSLDCGRPTSTIHSFLNLKVTEDFNTGKSRLTKNNNFQVHERKILVVDECSLIDTPLHNIIHEGTNNCKIVYVGDHCQMAPVTETISPVFCNNIPFYHLTEQRRTLIPELQALNQQARTTVETGVFNPIQIVPGIIDLLDDDDFQQAIDDHFVTQTLDNRILAYTNARAVEFNDYIRSLRGLSDVFSAGEFLINNTAMQLKDYMLSVEEEVEILNVSPNVLQFFVCEYDGEKIYLDTLECDIRTRLGMTFQKLRIPKDREHFTSILKWLASRKDWATMYGLKKKILDLRQRDASTVYKAQGSSLDAVFVDLSNISKCHNPSQAARMLYVTFSRARKRIIMHGELAQKYGGLIF